MEMTLENVMDRTSEIDHADFLVRAEMLGAVGLSVVISSHGPFYPLSAFCAATRPAPSRSRWAFPRCSR